MSDDQLTSQQGDAANKEQENAESHEDSVIYEGQEGHFDNEK